MTPPINGVLLRAGALAWSMLGILALGYVFLRYLVAPLSVIIAPLVLAMVVVYLLNPVVTWLELQRVPRPLAVALVFATWLSLFVVLLSWLIPLLVDQISGFVDQGPAYVETIVERLNSFAEARGFDWRISLESQDVTDFFAENRDQIVSFLGGLGSFAGQVLHIVATLVIGLILSVYILSDLPGMRRRMQNRLPMRYRSDAKSLGDQIGSSLGAFFRGQLAVATFVGVASTLVLMWPVRLPFALLVGVVAGIFNLVPLVGPFLAMIPAVVIGSLSDRPISALWAVVALAAVQQIDNHVISPNVVGRSVQLHPITVMLGLLVGGTIAGILGMLVTIPIIAVSKIIMVWFWQRQQHMFAVPSEST